ncbi:regulator of microtubule dynamics 2 [Phyllostomus discolor]|nr:regulator of microtubule dynamics 2 [Phyllostomus discolor]
MGKCLSCWKEDQPDFPVDQVPSEALHHRVSSITQASVPHLDHETSHPKLLRVSLSSWNTPSRPSFCGRRPSLLVKLQKSSTSLQSQQSRVNFDSQEKSNFGDLKAPSEHFHFKSRRPSSAPKLSIISCYESALSFDLQPSCGNIFNPSETDLLYQKSNITDTEKGVSSCSHDSNIKCFMNFETQVNSSASRNSVARNNYEQKSRATSLSLPAHMSCSYQESELATDTQERSQLRYITANTDTEEQSFPVLQALNTHTEELNLDVLLQRADHLRMNEFSKMESFELLWDHKEKFRDEIEFIWRFARAYGDMYEISTNTQEKKHYANIGKTLGEKAITRAPMNGHCHLWYAVLCGYVSEFEGLQNKINYGHQFKEHLDKAIELLPEEPFLYYLKGRYCYAVSRLTWIEKKMAATLFGKIPSSTTQEALQNFLKVEDLCPGFSKINYMFLAKCSMDLKQTEDAVKFCDLAMLLPSVTREDKDAEDEVKKISSTLKR